MKITWDRSVGTACLYLDDNRQFGRVDKTEPLHIPWLAGELLAGFDVAGGLVEFEIFGASKVLPEQVLATAEILGEEVRSR